MPRDERYRDYRDLYHSLFNDVTTQIRRLEKLCASADVFDQNIIANICDALILAQQKTEEMFIECFRPECELIVLGKADRTAAKQLEVSNDSN